MAGDVLGLMSVEQVASILGVHVRTVRRYLREGLLKGARIGKQYRIAAADLAQLTGSTTGLAEEPVRRVRHSEASSVVQIDAIAREDAIRVMNGICGAIK